MVSEKLVVEQALQREQEELAVERASRQKAEQERDGAIAGRQEAEERLPGGAGAPHAPGMSRRYLRWR